MKIRNKNTNFSLPILMIITFALFTTGCSKAELHKGTPQCFSELITEQQPQKVYKWVYNNKDYYYFLTSHFDGLDYLYNNECYLICAPSGGIWGGGSGNCPDWVNDTNIKKSLIWQK